MFSIFHTKINFFWTFLLLGVFAFGQNDIETQEPTEDNSKFKPQNLLNISFNYAMPLPTGENFAGLGLKGKGEYAVKSQVYVYKGFFVSGAIGDDFLKVKDIKVVGNYNKTTVSRQYLSAGYEIQPLQRTRLGFSYVLYGESSYRNKGFDGTREFYQRDSGKTKGFGAYFDYLLNDNFAVFLNYDFRKDKMDIKTSSEIQHLFDNANFNIIGFGIKVFIGDSDVVSRI